MREGTMKMVNVMPGNRYNNFTQVYVAYANKVISEFVAQGKPEKILREKIEIQILGVIDQMDFPTEFRLAYFSMIAHTNVFDVYWMGMRESYGLRKASITRVKPDYDMIFNLPPLNPPDSPTDSDAYSSAGSVADSDSGSGSEDEAVGATETDADGHIATDGAASRTKFVSPIADEFSPPPTPTPESKQAGKTPPAKRKRGARNTPAKPTAKRGGGGRRKASGAQKSPRTANIAERNSEATEAENPGTEGDGDDNNDGGLRYGPIPGQTGSKTVAPPQTTGAKRGRSTGGRGRGSRGGRGGGAKKVRFDVPEE